MKALKVISFCALLILSPIMGNAEWMYLGRTDGWGMAVATVYIVLIITVGTLLLSTET